MDISKVSKLDFFNFNINTAGSGQFEIVLKVGGDFNFSDMCACTVEFPHFKVPSGGLQLSFSFSGTPASFTMVVLS